MKPKIVILIGNIGAGKTTLCSEFIKKEFVCISRDSLRYMIGSGDYIFNRKYEPVIHRAEKIIIEEFMSERINLVIDEVGVSKWMRQQYIYLAEQYNYEITAVVLPKLSMEQSVNRRMISPHGQPNRKLWEAVWTKFDEQYEQPTKKEGFDKVIFLK